MVLPRKWLRLAMKADPPYAENGLAATSAALQLVVSFCRRLMIGQLQVQRITYCDIRVK